MTGLSRGALQETTQLALGPRNLSPLKWMRWSGISAIQTSVSQAILSTCCLNCRKSGKALTYTRVATQSFKVTSSSSTRLGFTGAVRRHGLDQE